VLLLDVKDLRTYFYTDSGVVKAVDGFSFSLEREKTLGIVGESGCGKSLTALSIMGLVPPPGRVEGGEILFDSGGTVIDLPGLNPKGKQMRSIRGNEIAMIFQEPMTALDPIFSVGDQIMEAITLHQNLSKRQARQKTIDMLYEVGIPLPKQRIDDYPHQFSGGMRQRVMIAMALSCNPSLLIADEPTTALDVTIQAQILDLMVELRAEFKTAIIMITHDLGVVAEMADDVIIMYVGEGVEKSSVHNIYHDPRHPYTRGLMDSVPSITSRPTALRSIKGVVPDPLNLPPGCRFEPRCPRAMDICRAQHPSLTQIATDHWVACWLYE
jgi:oligopeptide/dipeptide ABC transporter ATP-binding protein